MRISHTKWNRRGFSSRVSETKRGSLIDSISIPSWVVSVCFSFCAASSDWKPIQSTIGLVYVGTVVCTMRKYYIERVIYCGLTLTSICLAQSGVISAFPILMMQRCRFVTILAWFVCVQALLKRCAATFLPWIIHSWRCIPLQPCTAQYMVVCDSTIVRLNRIILQQVQNGTSGQSCFRHSPNPMMH